MRRRTLSPMVAGLWMAAVLAASPALAQQVTGTPGSPSATTTIDGRYLPPPPQPFGGEIELNAAQSKPWLAAARRAAEGRAQHPADHDRRRRLRRALAPSAASSRRRRSTASPPNGLRYTNFHSTSLCSPTRAALITGRNHHSVGFGVDLRGGDRLPRLQQHHRQGQRHDRPDPAGQRLPHLLVRQGPQHADLDREPGRAVRPVADRHGLRLLLRLRRRRHQPVAAEPVPQHHGDLPLCRQARLEPDHRDGRRRHPLAEPAQRHQPVDAVLPLLRARRHPRAAPSDAGVDQEDQRHAPVRQGLERAARADLRQPEEARRDPAGRQADALAGRPAEALGSRSPPRRRSCSSARPTSTPPISPTPTTRSAG